MSQVIEKQDVIDIPEAGGAEGCGFPSSQGESRAIAKIHARYREPMAAACSDSAVPVEFLAALTANESAAVAGAARFEPAVYRHLKAAVGRPTLDGGIPAAGSERVASAEAPAGLSAVHARYLTPAFAANHRERLARLGDDALRQLATSWGPTQIMGYHVVGRGGAVPDLLEIGYHYSLAVELLTELGVEYQLNLASEFREMFRCWTTGRPYGQPPDPNYVANGLQRMRLYRAIAARQAGEAEWRPAPFGIGLGLLRAQADLPSAGRRPQI